MIPGSVLVQGGWSGIRPDDQGFLSQAVYHSPPSFTITSFPTDGALNVNHDASFDYTPDMGFTGTDSFDYELFASGVSLGAFTVTLNVASSMVTVIPGEVTVFGGNSSSSMGTISGMVMVTGGGSTGSNKVTPGIVQVVGGDSRGSSLTISGTITVVGTTPEDKKTISASIQVVGGNSTGSNIVTPGVIHVRPGAMGGGGAFNRMTTDRITVKRKKKRLKIIKPGRRRL